MKITHHTTLLNALIEKHNLKSYLEIGVQNPANNFDKIECDSKVGVDPEVKDRVEVYEGTSDEYFIGYGQEGDRTMHDIVFIDGLHHADQVKRDFENSLACLNDCGFIVIHDCLPTDEATTKVPRETKVWHGDVYKFCMQMRNYWMVDYKTFDIDHGCMVIWKNKNNKPKNSIHMKCNWELFSGSKKKLLNIVDEVTI